MNRLPPNCEDSERGVLGCILLSPDCLDETVNLFPAGAQTFYVHAHGVIYTALLELHEKRLPLDLIAVQSKLKSMGKLEEVGGIGYVSQLSDAVPSAANLAYYASIVVEKWKLRQTIKACSDGLEIAYSEPQDVNAVVDGIASSFSVITESKHKSGSMRDYMEEVVNDFERRFNSKGEITGLSTGFSDIDQTMNGLQPGMLAYLAARPSCGKTSLACNIAENIAIDQKIPVGILSLETSAVRLASRMLCSRARFNQKTLGTGATQDDFFRLVRSAPSISSCPIRLDDQRGITVLQAKSKLRAMVREHGIKFAVVDYLQLLKGTKNTKQREQEVAECSIGMKEIAGELNIPILVLAQLNRESEKEARRPRMSDLRESGQIEQDADWLGFLWRAEPPSERPARFDDPPAKINLTVAKNKDGETTEIYLSFFKQFTRFEQTSRLEER